jgi:hypothetical protein
MLPGILLPASGWAAANDVQRRAVRQPNGGVTHDGIAQKVQAFDE